MDGASTTMDSMTDQDEQQNLDPVPQSDEEHRADPSSETEAEEQGVDGVAEQADEPIEIQPLRVVEAILLAADTPVSASKIAMILDVGTARDVKKHIETLNRQYEELQFSFRIEQIAGGYQILTLPAYNTWLTKLLRARQETKLSPAAMETLAIVAYKQPCTRADVEAIRGVAAGDMMNRLREMNLIKIVGRAEDLGRPMLYGTTKRFLEAFGLPSLEDLPQVEAFKSGAPSEKAEKSEPQAEAASTEESVAEETASESPKEVSDDGETDTAEPDASASKLSVVHDEEEEDAT
ncbi:MAG: SMC-Scp complex subunit ScpB [Phycisphaerales bacterium]|nr:SMC-Scp complex subunit ScpB [Phycisphaerales bacterium]